MTQYRKKGLDDASLENITKNITNIEKYVLKFSLKENKKKHFSVTLFDYKCTCI